MREGEPSRNDEQNHKEKVEINEPLEAKELFELLTNAGLERVCPGIGEIRGRKRRYRFGDEVHGMSGDGKWVSF